MQPKHDLSASDRRALLATCVAGAASAAKLIRERAETHTSITWEEKGRADFVSEVDRGAEEIIAAIVHERHKDARMLGEELSPALDLRSGLSFVVDPLDGTTNFLHGFPWYAVSIAALVDGDLQASAVLNVPTGELFTATLGGGARRNGQPIAVSTIDQPLRALVGTGMPFKHGEHIENYLRMMSEVMRGTAGIRRPGSAALDLADVACGRFDAFWEMRLAPWDIAAGILLVREAGGVITDLAGAPVNVDHTGLVAGNAKMHAWLMDVLTSATR
ncbi:MAG TPA: inositol monophosphatase family protein [Gemmatimonadaceae bacterium]